jgi:ABC-2 type transport system permease protein
VAWAFFARGVQEALSLRFASVLYAAGMALSMLSFYFLSRFVDTARPAALAPWGGDYLAFGLIGIVGLDFLYTAAGACARRLREAQVAGTLEPMVATATPDAWVILCLPLYDYASALGRAALWLGAGAWIFGARFSPDPLGALAALALAAAAFGSLGLLSAAATLWLRRTDPVSSLLGALSMVFSGVFYPTSVLPAWAAPLSTLLPTTHALDALRAAALGGGPGGLLPPLLRLAAFTALCGPVALLAFRAALSRARTDGSLGQY